MLSSMNANSYLILLIMMQMAMLTFSLLGQFNQGVYFVVIRVLFLVMAQCLKRPRSAAFYSVLGLMNAFYSFDPVGLFVTGRTLYHLSFIDGQSRTLAANIFCVIACALAFISSYIGFYFKVALESENPDQNETNNSNPTFMYGGNNTGYINPNDNNNRNQSQARSFQPFQGQGYALD